MPKPEGIKELKVHFHECFSEYGEVFPACEDITIASVDFIASVKSLSNPSIVKWEDAFNGLQNETKHALRKFRRLKTVVNSCDSYHFSNYAKFVEQAQRDAQKLKANGGVPRPKVSADFTPGAMGDPIDQRELAAAMEDRDNGIPVIIRWFILHLLTDKTPDFLKAGDGRKIVYDGHYLREGDLDNLGIKVHPHAPLAISRHADGELKIEFLQHLAHKHGEADLAILWLIRHLAHQGEVCAILSPDSDMIWNSLRFLAAHQNYAPHILVRRWPMLSWCVSANPFPDIERLKARDQKEEAEAKASGIPRKGVKKGQQWVDINKLYEQISQMFPGIPEEERVTSFAVMAAVGAGCDYLDEIKGVPIHHWFKQWMTNYQTFGPLTKRSMNPQGEYEWEIVSESLQKLIEHACQQAGTRKKEAVTGPFKKPAKKYPGENGVKHLINHTRYWAIMMNSIGTAECVEPPLDKYSYVLVNRNIAPTRQNANLVRAHGDAPMHEWSARFQEGISAPEKPKRTPLSAFGSKSFSASASSASTVVDLS